MSDRNYLFNNIDWHSVDQHQRKELAKEIDGINGDRLLNTSVDDLCDYFEKKYKIEVPALRPENIVADQRETKIDVSGDPGQSHQVLLILSRSDVFASSSFAGGSKISFVR